MTDLIGRNPATGAIEPQTPAQVLEGAGLVADGTNLALPGAVAMFSAVPVTAQLAAITTVAVSALTTVGVASLSTTQTSNLTTEQLNTLCVNNDLLVPAVLKVETDLNAVRAALQKIGITA